MSHTRNCGKTGSSTNCVRSIRASGRNCGRGSTRWPELHPDSRYIHLGADETWHLATCPQCRERAERDPRGKLGVYLDHVAPLCRYALGKGLRPLIWGDMFLRENRSDLLAELPDGTIPVDWQYDAAPPYPHTAELLRSGRPFMGASGVAVGWWEHCFRIQNEPTSRLRNVVGWNRFGREHGLGVIHTTWGRAGSLWNIYSPWNGALPVFLAAGDPDRWEKHPWRTFFEDLEPVMWRDTVAELKAAADRALALLATNELERSCLEWWHLALCYQALEKHLRIAITTRQTLDRVKNFVGQDPECYRQNVSDPMTETGCELDAWEVRARAFWRRQQWSDEEEYFATHSGMLRAGVDVQDNRKTVQ